MVYYQYTNWYIENKDRLLTRMWCACGGHYTHNARKKHLYSKKHQDYIYSLNN